MPSSFGSLTGQVALITGGAGGLGREAALWLAVAGAQVVVADVSAAALERAETWLSEKLPDFKTDSVQGSGQYIQEEQPAKVVDAVTELDKASR